MWMWVGWWWGLGCIGGDGGRRAPTTVSCTEDTTLRVTAPAAPLASRARPGTEVHQCVDAQDRLAGPHLERYPDEGGGVAVEGAWAAGRPDGTWTIWRRDGAFLRSAVYVDGVAEGEWLEVTSDGRITAIRFDLGIVVGLESLPADAVMPEWDEGRASEGRRYQSGP